jgi:hypothetical protein
LPAGSEYFDGFVGTTGFSMSSRRWSSFGHWPDLSTASLLAELAVLTEHRREADVDVIGMVAHRERRPAELEQRNDLIRGHRALQRHQPPHRLLSHSARLGGALTREEFESALTDSGLGEIEIQETHRVHEHAAAAIVRARKPD